MKGERLYRLEQADQRDLQFIRDAVLNGDKEAAAILKRLEKLDEKYNSLYADVETRQWLPRKSWKEHQEYYKFAIPRIKRLKVIPEERRRIIYSDYRLDQKKPLIYLQTLKRTKKENSLKNL